MIKAKGQPALSASEFIDAQQNAETRFNCERMPSIVATHPRLCIVCEHITTWAPDHVDATITQQDLIFTLGHLI